MVVKDAYIPFTPKSSCTSARYRMVVKVILSIEFANICCTSARYRMVVKESFRSQWRNISCTSARYRMVVKD